MNRNRFFSPKLVAKMERKLQTVSKGGYYNTYVPNPLVEENLFLTMKPEERELPSFEQAKDALPRPFWNGHDAVIACYWKAWELAMDHLRKPDPKNDFVANYIDTAFNDCLFMWDSCFILMFAKYGHRVFSFQRTLDNLYRKQHPDGFICRQISEIDGEDRFHRFDPTSTGPNIMAWSEWEYFQMTGDIYRLKLVFPVLVAYHRWLKAYRTWPNGTYWSSGWGSGMDNQPRLPEDMSHKAEEFYHGHLVWLDTCLQQALSAKLVLSMAAVLRRVEDVTDFQEELDHLSQWINNSLWDEEAAYYYDLQPNDELSGMKSIGAYWALLADLVPQKRLARFVAHLENVEEFNRPHRIPTLSADHSKYESEGDYWKGAVWAPTNYMVLRGLSQIGYDGLAHEIASNHLQNVVDVFRKTGTIWENYAPEMPEQGKPAKPNFVGWGGLSPIAILLEYVFGLRADVPNSKLVWDVRLLDEHGVMQYAFGNDGLLDLKCGGRSSAAEKPVIHASSSIPIELLVRWKGGEETVLLTAGRK